MASEHRAHLVVMGVSGCGKTTIAGHFAASAGAEFLDADDLHPRANIAKMAEGIALTDADRRPWLAAVREEMRARAGGCVVACSALRRQYRDVLREAAETVAFVHLRGSPAVITARLSTRSGHFMPTALLDSQFASLESLEPDELGIVLDAQDTPAEIVTAVGEFTLAAGIDLAPRTPGGESA
ncbi:gluconokinase [Nocardia callitridis]|uniref:Gluconokinase n=1 Tax=Nocardia callitridis TaxID=648753 RepID=A0ABP9KYJ8_9NOCA